MNNEKQCIIHYSHHAKRPSLPHTALSLTNYSAHDKPKTHNASCSKAQRKPVPVLKMPLQSQDALEIAISRRGVVRAKRRQHTATLPDSVSTAPQRHHPWPSQSQSLLRSRSIRPCRTAPPPPSDHAELDPSKPDPAGEGPLRVVDHHALQDQSYSWSRS